MCMYAHAPCGSDRSIYLSSGNLVFPCHYNGYEKVVAFGAFATNIPACWCSGRRVNFVQEAVFPLSELSFGFCGDLNGYGLLAHMFECLTHKKLPYN